MDAAVAGNSQLRVLALASQKGGSGKTTIAVHLAVALTRPRRQVVLIDTDPQRSAAAWAQSREAPHPALIECDAGRIGTVLRQLRAQGAGLAIIDTEPSTRSDIASVARAADFTLIPARPSIVDLRAVGGTVDVVKQVRGIAAIVLNAVPAPRAGSEAPVTTEARSALRQYGVPVLPVTIGSRIVLAHALASGLAVGEFDPTSRAAVEVAALANFVEHKLWPSHAPALAALT